MNPMKLAKIIALMLSLALLAGIFVACKDDPENSNGNGDDGIVDAGPFALPTGFSGIDFSDGNIGFLMNHFRALEASSETKVELSEFRGAPAVKITPAEDSSQVFLAIDAESLLGARISDLRRVEVHIGIENPGEFAAVSGNIRARTAENVSGPVSTWNIFAETVNPRMISLDLPNALWAGDGNLIIIERLEDAAGTSRRTESNIFIMGIAFLDEGGNALPVDTSVTFNEPLGFNEVKLRNVHLHTINGNSAPSLYIQGWHSFGTLGADIVDYLSSDFNLALTFVVEFSEPPKGDVGLYWMGTFSNFVWVTDMPVIARANSGETRFEVDLASTIGNDFARWPYSHETRFWLYYGGHECDTEVDENGEPVWIDVDMDYLIPYITNAYFIAEEKTRVHLVILGDGADGNLEFPIAADDGNPHRAGWFAVEDEEILASMHPSRHFRTNFRNSELQQAHTLIFEFDEILTGAIGLAWEGEGGIGEEVADIRPGGVMERTRFSVDLNEIFDDWGGDAFMNSDYLRLYIIYDDMPLSELPLSMATFVFG
jgi:hypothetical protein